MKKIILSTLMMSLAITAHSQEKKSEQLAVNRSVAESSHLTTRIQWTKFPKVDYRDADLNGRDRHAIVRIKADEKGHIVQATVQESTGLSSLDQKIIQAVMQAKTKPFIKRGNPLAIVGYQMFSLELSPQTNGRCYYEFDSKQWQAQQNNPKATYRYTSQPELELPAELLADHDRQVKFRFKADKQGNIEQAKITQGSGQYALDQQVLNALQGVKVEAPRKYWVYKKSHFKDEIQFKLSECAD